MSEDEQRRSMDDVLSSIRRIMRPEKVDVAEAAAPGDVPPDEPAAAGAPAYEPPAAASVTDAPPPSAARGTDAPPPAAEAEPAAEPAWPEDAEEPLSLTDMVETPEPRPRPEPAAEPDTGPDTGPDTRLEPLTAHEPAAIRETQAADGPRYGHDAAAGGWAGAGRGAAEPDREDPMTMRLGDAPQDEGGPAHDRGGDGEADAGGHHGEADAGSRHGDPDADREAVVDEEARPLPALRAAHDRLPERAEPGTGGAVMIDEGMLEDMIRRVIRAELVEGEIGRNISENVQRLIEDEVRRALRDRG